MSTRIVKLGTVCTVVSGSTPKSEVAEYWDGDVKWITPAELTEDSYIITDSVRHITSQAVHDTSLKPFPEGTVILSSRAPIGKTAIAGCEMYCNQGFKNLICSPQIDPKYLYCFLSGKTDFLNSLGRGATFKEISKSIVENIEIPLPELAVQRQISLQFEHIRALIKQYREQLHYLDQLVKSRFIEMFGDPIKNSMAWPYMPLAEICEDIFGGGTPSKSHPEFFAGHIPWVTPKDMKQAVISDSIDHITADAVSHSTTNLIPAQSVLMVIRSGILKHTLPVAINSIPVTINQDMKAFIPCEAITAAFLMYYFKAIESDVLAGVRSVTADNIDFKAFVKRNVIVPPIHLQEQFTAFVTQSDKSKVEIQNALNELEILKKSLMQQYFG